MRPSVEGRIVWLAGDSAITDEIDLCLAEGLGRTNKLHHTPRRSVYKIGLKALASSSPSASAAETGPHSLAFKIHHLRPGVHALREGVKRRLFRSSGRREWHALRRLHALGVPVPTPRAWGRLPSGDEVVACDFIEGIPLLDCVPTADEAMQEALLASLGESLAALYAEGFRHGDLHVGNLMVLPSPRKDKEQIVLLDVQSATRSRREATRLTDLARLELSLLRAGFAPAARAALRAQLQVGHAFPRAYARFLKDYVRGRARRVLAVGRRTAEAKVDSRLGLRASRFPNEALALALKNVQAQLEEPPNETRRGGRVRLFDVNLNLNLSVDGEDGDGGEEGALVIKQTEAGSWRRALADRFRGSPAARAFHKARAIAVLAERAATPLAFVEERRFTLPLRSWLVLERHGEQDMDTLRLPPGEAQMRLGRAFGRWLAEGHALGLSHRDAKGNNVRVHQSEGEWHFAWIDLEDLTGPDHVRRRDRIRLWSQIGASLPDAYFRIDARLAAFDAYEEQIAYADGESGSDSAGAQGRRKDMLREIAEASLARQHRWRGEDCACLTDSRR